MYPEPRLRVFGSNDLTYRTCASSQQMNGHGGKLSFQSRMDRLYER